MAKNRVIAAAKVCRVFCAYPHQTIQYSRRHRTSFPSFGSFCQLAPPNSIRPVLDGRTGAADFRVVFQSICPQDVVCAAAIANMPCQNRHFCDVSQRIIFAACAGESRAPRRFAIAALQCAAFRVFFHFQIPQSIGAIIQSAFQSARKFVFFGKIQNSFKQNSRILGEFRPSAAPPHFVRIRFRQLLRFRRRFLQI